ncbi:unnamed protein product [Symbiodinium sp. CCMP2592]|nr:unnamed protein product [Symbiodinium sp. CCMP2592]
MAAVPFARSFVLLTYIATAETAPPEAHQPLDRLQKEVDGLMRLRQESQKVAASSRYAPEAEGETAETDAKHAVSVAEALLEEENKELREALANRRKQSLGKASLLESKATSSVSTHRETSPAAAADASSWHLVLLLQAAMVIVGLALGALFWTMQRADRAREARISKLHRSRYGSQESEPRNLAQAKPSRLPAGVVDEDEEEATVSAVPAELRFAPPREVWSRA